LISVYLHNYNWRADEEEKEEGSQKNSSSFGLSIDFIIYTPELRCCLGEMPGSGRFGGQRRVRHSDFLLPGGKRHTLKRTCRD
jgi:hypothetical protein